MLLASNVPQELEENMRIVGVASIVSLFAVVAIASETGSKGSPPKSESKPCRVIVKACRAAGFEKGKWLEGKGLFADCIAPIIAHGRSVEGVKIDPANVGACKQRIQERRQEL